MSCKHIGKIVAAADMANLVAGGAAAYADDIKLYGGGGGNADIYLTGDTGIITTAA